MKPSTDVGDQSLSNPAEEQRATVDSVAGCMAAQRYDEAAAQLAVALRAWPEWAKGHALWAITQWQRGDIDAASAAFDRALGLDPSNARFKLDRASFLLDCGRRAEAVEVVEAIIGDFRDNVAAQVLRIKALAANRETERALAAAADAAAALPDSVQLLWLKGALERAAGRLREALASQLAALAKAPDFAASLFEAGTTLQLLGRPDEAIVYLDRALEQDGDHVGALLAIGMAESDLDMHEAAGAALDRAAQLAPTDTDVALKRGIVLQRMGRIDAAIEQFELLIALEPTSFSAHSNIGACYLLRGRYGEAVEWLEKACALRPDKPSAYSNRLFAQLHATGTNLAELARAHRAFGERFGTPEGRYRDWPNDLDPDRRLRIGLVSAEFCGHASNTLIIPFLEGIDRRQFALIGFSNNPARDTVTTRFEGLLDGIENIVGLDDRSVAEEIQRQAIDILIDLTGHTGMNRLTCFALKPAPVQASWIGYPFTTGLGAIDYSIMDSIAVRPGEEVHFVETVVRLEGSRICIEPPAVDMPVDMPPSLKTGRITFGSFNRVNKVTNDVLRTWAQILRAVPNSRLMLKDRSFDDGGSEVERVTGVLGDEGIDAGRLDLRGRSDYTTYLREHGEFDIALDPFPFSGAATSVDALWMGLPIVTLPGELPVSRQTATFLNGFGRWEWIASTTEEYITIAARLASDPLRLADLRSGQRAELRRSPLCDKHRAARDLERALRWMWQQYAGSRVSA